eukprot:2397475-Pleurochrysis_carterae.AAC.1
MPAAEFVRALEAAMDGVGRVTAAIAEAAGRPHVIAALTSADSGPALRAAEADWLEVHAAAL